MPYDKLNILVLLRECSDPRPPARVTTRGASISERGLRYISNPADLSALEAALRLKDTSGANVTVVTIGPPRLDDMLRLAASLGADRLIRFWDHGIDGGDVVADARIVAGITGILNPDLVFTGNSLADRGNDPVPALAAAASGRPCITSVVSFAPYPEWVEAERKSDKGARQKVSAPVPCTVLFEESVLGRYPAVDALVDALTVDLEEWNLSHIGLPTWSVGGSGGYLPLAEFAAPRPDPVRVVTPDPQLPAFERILSLLSGGIKAREGRQYELPVEETAGRLVAIFREEGLLPG